tara:strand:- start:186 stop:869 length:684 start_codon:yes stop_codon:yes gene_type:complete
MKKHRYDLEKIVQKINKLTKIIYIANPDNPMGTYITRDEFDQFYSRIPERVLIILDEAYFEFAQSIDDYPNSMNYRYDNVITLRTFSKAYGLAGLRIGYGFAHDALISNLMKVKEPFEPSLIALTAGVAAMDDTEFLEKTIAMNQTGYTFLENKLQSLGVEIIPSAANFITTVWNSGKRAAEITQSLLRKGIIVRSLTAFGWPEYIRVSIGTETENRRFIDALKTLL